MPGPVVAPPTVETPGERSARGALVVIDMSEVAAALQAGAARLSRMTLPPDAPPAFLLDWRRRTGAGVTPRPGMFDNRSVSLPTDFPSANLLRSRGVRAVVLIQPAPDPQPQADLAHTLRRWQEAGVDIRVAHPGDLSSPQPAVVAKAPLVSVRLARDTRRPRPAPSPARRLRRFPAPALGGMNPAVAAPAGPRSGRLGE